MSIHALRICWKLSSWSWNLLLAMRLLETKLVIKNHPLDLGLMHYSRVIRQLAARFDLTGRVVYLETGDLR